MPSTSASREILVITAKNSSEHYLNRKKIGNIFLRKLLINKKGKAWVPVNLSTNHPLRIAFSETLFDQRPEEMEVFWNIKYFQGISPPFTVESQQAMLRFVSSTPDSIGYISPCFINDEVKIIFRLMLQKKINLDTQLACKDAKVLNQ